jgi:hypothetical protein
MEACHNDGNPTNNSIKNLRWGTPKDNRDDARKHGTLTKGERIGNARLNEEKVRTIRSAYASGTTARIIAKNFQVSEATIWCVLKKRTWVYVV